MLIRLRNDVLYVRLNVPPKLVEDVSDPNTHRGYPG
jgi:hypothetical protein